MAQRPRLSVFRSNRHLYAQIIDDEKGKTLAAASEKALEKSVKSQNTTKTEKAELLGAILAKEALAKKIKKVVFDRNRFKYHGRIKALAEAVRKEGLSF